MMVFVDTGPLRALVSPRDQYRKQALATLDQLKVQSCRLVTSDDVLNEVFTGLIGDKRGGYWRILQLELLVFKQQMLQVEWVGRERFLQTKKLFLKVSKDKLWSFTDCTSCVVMKELKITQVFTFDEHFEQMGLEVVKG